MTITWCMVPEIWSMTEFFVILGHFSPFSQLTTQKWNFDKMKKPSRYHHFTQVYIKWQALMYGSWDLKCHRQNCLLFWAIFYPFSPPKNPPKVKILKKWKKWLKISFYTSVPKIMIICYTVPEIWCMIYVIYNFHFGLFALFPP